MAINKRDLQSIEGETGWPYVNYAQEDRNFQSNGNEPRSSTLSIPRYKYTWLAEFQINERVFENPVTNIREFLNNGKLYVQLLSVDHPKPKLELETLKSHNKWIKIPKQIQFNPASMTFHDDATATVMALWKEYLNFYSHSATIGDVISGGTVSNIRSSNEMNSYQFTHLLTGEEVRARMSDRPSLGMKLKANDMRHFFEAVTIYDLGTEPDGINVYWFHHPVITDWDHENLDKENSTDLVRVTANFEYEGYYFTVGQNRSRIRDWITQILGAFPTNGNRSQRKDGIARDQRAQATDRLVENWNNNAQPSVFPTDEAGARQSALTGVGAANNPQLPFASPEEQLFSPKALETLSGMLRTAAIDSGFDPSEFRNIISEIARFPGLSEPLVPSQTTPQLPQSIEGKQEDVARAARTAMVLQAALVEAGEQDQPQQQAILSRKLNEVVDRRNKLLAAISEQRRQLNRRIINNPSSQSALENTRLLAGGPELP